MPTAIGIDVGGTKIAGAVVEAHGATHGTEVVATPCDDDHGAAETLALIGRLLHNAQAHQMNVKRVGVGVPEYVTPDGRINSSLVLGSLRGLPAETASGTPLVFDSDVRCAARAESRFGHGSDFASFVFAIAGTGISSTFVHGGHLWPGHRGEAIALGELPVSPDLAINNAAPLTVEAQASGRAINGALKRSHHTVRASFSHKHAVLARAGEIVATALCSVVHLLDPAAVILGGGLGTSQGPFFDALSHSYTELTSGRPYPPPLLQTRLGPQAGIIGAGILALSDQ